MRPNLRSLAVAAIASSLLASSFGDLATTPISRLQTPWWAERFKAKQNELRSISPKLVWLGDSITQDWELNGPQPWQKYRPVWQTYYGGVSSINLGFKGDSTCHVLWRLMNGELHNLYPKALVLLIGANNFGHIHTGAEDTFLGIKQIVSLIHSHSARTRIVLIGVLPSLRSGWVDKNTALLNSLLLAYYKESKFVNFVDASAIFVKDGRVDPLQFIDPRLSPPESALHPTSQAQERIARLIAPIIEQDLREETP